MFSIISCLGATHDWRFVSGAIVVCLIGAFSTVIMLGRARECLQRHSGAWLAAASVTGGTSIWATHFIAMLAYDGGYPLTYDAAVTVFSVLISIAVTWAAFALAFRFNNTLSILAAGLVFGGGIAAMHFSGMHAVEAQAHLSHAPDTMALALGAGATLGPLTTLALRRLSGRSRVVWATLLITATVCTLHFLSMGGIALTPDPLLAIPGRFVLDRAALAAIVAAVSSALILLGGAAALMDRHLTDVQGLADAAMEGLLLVQEGRIVQVNESMLKLAGGSAPDLLGRRVGDILPSGALPCAAAAPDRASAVGELVGLDGSRTEVEILRREIEYRGRQSEVFAVRDLTERRRSERLIDFMARHDPLTGLANRREFDSRLAGLMHDWGGETLALICLDLDNFKAINDLRGHAAGDAVLRKVAAVLEAASGHGELVARLGGDEFTIVQTGQNQPMAAQQLCEAIIRGIAELSLADGQLIAFGTSIGVALASGPGETAQALHAQADAALYAAKKAGRNRIRFFDAALKAELDLRQQAEADLRRALAQGELGMEYQPFARQGGGAILGYSARIFWRHPSRGPLGAGEFLAWAGECGLLGRVIYQLIEDAAAEAQTWAPRLRLAVPLPAELLLLPGCYEEIATILRRVGMDPRRLDLVIPATILCSTDASLRSSLRRFKRMGVGIVLNDLVTQDSAFAALQQFGLDRVSVDAASVGFLQARFPPQAHGTLLDFFRVAGIEMVANCVVSELAPLPQENCSAPFPVHASVLDYSARRDKPWRGRPFGGHSRRAARRAAALP